jgi:hypothetical protein
MHCGWPALARVQELLLSALGEVPNCTFGNPILEMGVDPAKGKLLAALLTCLSKNIVRKTTIVAMIVLYCNSVFSSVLLECIFCFYRFI